MGRAESVVHIDIGQLRELGAEGVVVLFLLVVKAEIFQQRNLAVLQFRGGLLRHFAHAIVHEFHRGAEQAGESLRARSQALQRIALALRTAQMRAEQHAGALLMQIFQRRQRLADARVVGDGLLAVLFLQGDIVVHAHQHALAAQRKVSNRDLGHKKERCGRPARPEKFFRYDGTGVISKSDDGAGPRNGWSSPTRCRTSLPA